MRSKTDRASTAKSESLKASQIARRDRWIISGLAALALAMSLFYLLRRDSASAVVSISADRLPTRALAAAPVEFAPRDPVDESGFRTVLPNVDRWPTSASSAEIGTYFEGAAARMIQRVDQLQAGKRPPAAEMALNLFTKAVLLNFDGQTDEAYRVLTECRELLQANPDLATDNLYTIIYLQGLVGLRKGETENCIMCRGESSCILPIATAAIHQNTTGSRLAIQHFTEYLERFPEDQGVRWLLNVAHMTLGEHPQQVDPRYVISLDHFTNDTEYSIGKFRDIGHKLGVNRLNLGGGGIMEDFDGDGWLDIVVSSFDPTESMAIYRNTGQGKFEDLTKSSGLQNQKGGINCMQTDFENDGDMDVLVVRGAWLLPHQAMPLSLLQNNGDLTFTDITQAAGLGEPINSIAAGWADFDNDGWLDVFVASEYGTNRLYRNQQDGSFINVAEESGVAGSGTSPCKGVTWLDINNDGYQDLFLTYMGYESAQLFVNSRDGTFARTGEYLGIDGPQQGFTCWSWDYDNDGWLDIFATSYDRTLADAVASIAGQPNQSKSNRLYHNESGQGFKNVTSEAGLDQCFSTMGANFGDFDNDGFLDMYLGTGDPNYSLLVPNRMFRNLAGQQFADITASSGTGNLQKGHGTACGDWDGDGNVDLFIQMGGAVNGDKYHNILFQNPGHDNAWVTLKLVGSKTNRAAIGARIKVVTSEPNSRTIHRTVTSGSSFGANPLQQTIGLGKATAIDRVEIFWPVSRQTQVLTDVNLRQSRTIIEP